MTQETRQFGEQAAAVGQVADKSMDAATRGTVGYTEAIKVAARTDAEAAQANVAAAAKRRQSLEALRAEYIKIAATAEQGSAQQIAALRLQDAATKRLGETTAVVAGQQRAAASSNLLAAKVQGLITNNEVLAKGFEATNQAAEGMGISFSDASAASNDLNHSFAGMKNSTLLGLGALALLGVGAIQGTKQLLELTTEVMALQRVTGASAEDASRFGFQLKAVGINTATAIPALSRFSRNIADNSEKFTQAGVVIKRYANGTADVLGTYDNLRNRLRQTTDAGEKQAIMFALLGKGAVAMGASLGLSEERVKQLAEQSDKTGNTIQQSLVDQSLQLKIAMRSVNSEMEGVTLEMAKGLLPMLVKGADFVASFASEWTGAGDKVAESGAKIAGANESADKGSDFMDRVNARAGDMTDKLRDLGGWLGRHTGLMNDASDSTAQMAAAQEEEARAASELRPFVDALGESEEGAALDGDKLTEAAEKLKIKMDELAAPIGMTGAQLLEWAGSAQEAELRAKAVIGAMDATSQAFNKDFSFTATFSGTSLAKEAEAGASASDKLAKAQEHLAEVQAKAAEKGASATEGGADRATQSLNRVEKAQRSYAETVESSNERVADAQQSYAEAILSSNQRVADSEESYAETVEAQNQRVADSEQSLADLRISLAEAVEDAKERAADQNKSARQAVEDAEQRLNDLKKRQAASGNPELEREIAKQQELRDARQAVDRAREREREIQEEGVESIEKAEKDRIARITAAEQELVTVREEANRTIAEADEAVGKARVEAVKSVRNAEEQLADARTEAVKAVRNAEEQLAEARTQSDVSAAKGASSATSAARDLAKAHDAVAEAQKNIQSETVVTNRLLGKFPEHVREMKLFGETLRWTEGPMVEATNALDELIKKAGDLTPTQKKIVNFYQDSLIEGQAFSDNIRTAIKQGYDPGLISELLQKGPKEAGPILQEMISDHTGTLKNFVNAGQEALTEQSLMMRETARLTHIAVTSQSDQMNKDLDVAFAMMVANSGEGGLKTREALAKELNIGVEDVDRISKGFGIKIADGINPVLKGIGAQTVEIAGWFEAPPMGFVGAQGGFLPRDATLQMPGATPLVQWAEPETQGEYFIPRNPDRRPRAVGILAKAADDFGYEMVRKFADGGWILPSDVPQPPDLSGYGDKIGYTGDKANRHLYDLVVEFLRAHPPPSRGGPGGLSGSGYGFQAIINFLNLKGVEHVVTSTIRPGTLHGTGQAVDLDNNNQAIVDALRQIIPSLQEGIWSEGSTFSVAGGKEVPPSHWGADVWAQHGGGNEHVHAATWAGPEFGPGVPISQAELAGGGSVGVGGDLNSWITEALRITGKPEDWRAGLYARAMQESSGDPNAINLWDSNAARGTPSMGLMQTIQPTFDAHHVPGYDDIWNPVHNMAAAINYIESRYGSPYNLPAGGYAFGGLHGGPLGLQAGLFDQGGWLMPGTTLATNNTGAPERVMPAGVTPRLHPADIRAIGQEMARIQVVVGAGEVTKVQHRQARAYR